MAVIAASADERKQLRRAVVASTVGTSIEWYDFFLYSTATGLVFAKLFFPKADPLVATLNVFLIYAVGFIARPIGAAIFGHYGDRIGRKATLIATLVLMGVATFLIGFVPGYATIGIWGALLLVVLRFVQGVGVGGEWGGSVLLSMEWGHKRKRGLIASWPQFGVPVGLFLANGALLIMSNIAGPAGFASWGWRVPFYFSIVLVAVGLYVRLRVLETPLFQRILEAKRVEPAPVTQVIRRNWKEGDKFTNALSLAGPMSRVLNFPSDGVRPRVMRSWAKEDWTDRRDRTNNRKDCRGAFRRVKDIGLVRT